MVRVAWLVTLASACTAAFFLIDGLVEPSPQGLGAADYALLLACTVIPYIITRALQELSQPRRERARAGRPLRPKQSVRASRPLAGERPESGPRAARAAARGQPSASPVVLDKSEAARGVPTAAAVSDGASAGSLGGLVSRVFPKVPAR